MLKKRSDKVAFWGVPATSGNTVTYHRMRNFTEISMSKNAQEYSRKYVDMEFEESDVIGYAPSISIAFDADTENAMHADIIDIFDKEKIGDAAVRDIIVVDLTAPVTGNKTGYKALKRSYAVIPTDEGNDTDRYGYSATLKTKSSVSEVTATTTDGFDTITITENE